MRISDWSSDVCSSDLRIEGMADKPQFQVALSRDWGELLHALLGQDGAGVIIQLLEGAIVLIDFHEGFPDHPAKDRHVTGVGPEAVEIGRASCRAGVCQYV